MVKYLKKTNYDNLIRAVTGIVNFSEIQVINKIVVEGEGKPLIEIKNHIDDIEKK